MIAIIEPICKKFSHEKINSGFLTAFSLSYPDELIQLYAYKSHIDALINMLKHDKVVIENLSFVELKNAPNTGFLSIIKYTINLYRIFEELRLKEVDKLFFLSFSPSILWVIKNLLKLNKFSSLKFLFVLHGSFEDIAVDKKQDSPIFNNQVRSFKDLIKFFYHLCLYFIDYPWNFFNNHFFNFVKVLNYNHTNNFRYVAISSYIIENAKKYIDVNYFNIHLINFPTNFVDPAFTQNEEIFKMGVFGYGNSKKLVDISRLLLKEDIHIKFQIKIIGMDNRGLSDFPFIKFTSKGKPLTRVEMEKAAEDVDVFLILYESDKYRLSCSGSIFEALSYCKPIIHLENECINFYNNVNLPIGISCKSDYDFAFTIRNIIENNDRSKLFEFQKNILKLREKLNIKESIPQILKAFSWGPDKHV